MGNQPSTEPQAKDIAIDLSRQMPDWNLSIKHERDKTTITVPRDLTLENPMGKKGLLFGPASLGQYPQLTEFFNQAAKAVRDGKCVLQPSGDKPISLTDLDKDSFFRVASLADNLHQTFITYRQNGSDSEAQLKCRKAMSGFERALTDVLLKKDEEKWTQKVSLPKVP
jgi:hypothetical protein